MAWAQFDRGGAKTYESRYRHSAFFEVPFTTWEPYDIALGGSYRYVVNGNKFLGLFAGFQGRPFGKKVLIYGGNNAFFQLKEYRYLLSAGLDKRWWLTERLDFFTAVGGGFTFVDYRGTGSGTYKGHTIQKKEGWVPVVKAGFHYKISRFFFARFGYEYFDPMSISSGHRVYAGTGMLLSINAFKKIEDSF